MGGPASSWCGRVGIGAITRRCCPCAWKRALCRHESHGIHAHALCRYLHLAAPALFVSSFSSNIYRCVQLSRLLQIPGHLACSCSLLCSPAPDAPGKPKKGRCNLLPIPMPLTILTHVLQMAPQLPAGPAGGQARVSVHSHHRPHLPPVQLPFHLQVRACVSCIAEDEEAHLQAWLWAMALATCVVVYMSAPACMQCA